jgi:hypothetical protein
MINPAILLVGVADLRSRREREASAAEETQVPPRWRHLRVPSPMP